MSECWPPTVNGSSDAAEPWEPAPPPLAPVVGQRSEQTERTGTVAVAQKLKALAVLLAGPAPLRFTATTW
jgi:hypothetical protein